jgi:alcohol dehydrogenase
VKLRKGNDELGSSILYFTFVSNMKASVARATRGFVTGNYCIGKAQLARGLATMNALVYEGPGKRSWKSVPKATLISPKDVVIKTVATTICGTDLHICKGDVPDVKPGTTLGHEGIGVVEEVGSDVKKFKRGDKVVVSCITSCGNCYYCKKNLQSHCLNGGWLLGHLINGTQAEYTRIPHADFSLYAAPDGVPDKALLMLSDILPTGYEIGVLAANIQPGDSVAIVGAGPIGLSCLTTCQSFKPSRIIMIDRDDQRLEAAKKFGATDTINPDKVANLQDAVNKITKEANKLKSPHETLELGVDVAIECVGIPDSWDICQKIITSGGRIANVGVHGSKVDFNLHELWIKNITVTTGLVNANSTGDLLNRIVSRSMDPMKFVTHDFPLCEICQAYDVFGNASKNNALKMFLKA